MRRYFALVAAAGLVLVMAYGWDHPAAAKVVRDGRLGPANPAVAVGGVRLRGTPRPAVQYSLIGALAAEGRWFSQCAVWPWRLMGGSPLPRRWVPDRWPERPPVDWLPPLP
jgi:hypothetical protein